MVTSRRKNDSGLLGEALLKAIREAVREEIRAVLGRTIYAMGEPGKTCVAVQEVVEGR